MTPNGVTIQLPANTHTLTHLFWSHNASNFSIMVFSMDIACMGDERSRMLQKPWMSLDSTVTASYTCMNTTKPEQKGRHFHDDIIKWKHFPCYWPFVREIHRGTVNSPHKGQWRGALMFSLICVWITGWVNNGEAGDLRRHRAHYVVTVMLMVAFFKYIFLSILFSFWLKFHWIMFLDIPLTINQYWFKLALIRRESFVFSVRNKSVLAWHRLGVEPLPEIRMNSFTSKFHP